MALKRDPFSRAKECKSMESAHLVKKNSRARSNVPPPFVNGRAKVWVQLKK